ncbi:MAG: OmpA family protein [Alphaproteobacteria bacterium]|nr:OmpA family protein [Alphaproteobacteria bacterium]
MIAKDPSKGLKEAAPAAGPPLILNRQSEAEEAAESSDDWLLTYCDTVTLLITFFVLLIMQASFTEPEQGEGMLDGLLGIMPAQEGVVGDAGRIAENPEVALEIAEQAERPAADSEAQPAEATTPKPPITEPPITEPVIAEEVWAEIARLKREIEAQELSADAELAQEQQRLFAGIASEIEDVGLSDLVTPTMTAEGVSLRVSNQVLFPTAEAALSPTGEEVVRSLLPILAGKPFDIEVEGHTDSVPIATYDFPSNWHLSAIRAISVLQVLEAAGIDATRLHAVGYGETRPIEANDTADGRAANRRVEILLKY